MISDPLVHLAAKDTFRILRLDKSYVFSRRVVAGSAGNP